MDCSAQTMDPHGLFIRALRKLDCMHTTVNPRAHCTRAGKAYVSIYCLHKAWAVGLQARHVEKNYHSYMQAFATEY